MKYNRYKSTNHNRQNYFFAHLCPTVFFLWCIQGNLQQMIHVLGGPALVKRECFHDDHSCSALTGTEVSHETLGKCHFVSRIGYYNIHLIDTVCVCAHVCVGCAVYSWHVSAEGHDFTVTISECLRWQSSCLSVCLERVYLRQFWHSEKQFVLDSNCTLYMHARSFFFFFSRLMKRLYGSVIFTKLSFSCCADL